MRIKKIKKTPLNKAETIWEMEVRLKKEAVEIAKDFVHTKPVKYLLKR